MPLRVDLLSAALKYWMCFLLDPPLPLAASGVILSGRMSDEDPQPQPPHRTYNATEKAVAMFIALRDGVSNAAVHLNIPAQTIYGWLNEAGGIRELNKSLNEQLSAGLSVTEMEIMSALRKAVRKGDFPPGLLAELFAVLAKLHLQRFPDASGQMVAAAASVNVWQIGSAPPRPTSELTPEELQLIEGELFGPNGDHGDETPLT